ncbi:MAG TPA: nucleotide sugar dehydrogenase [Verrucomicrobiae bacterium]|nr:nucleotide sugar dehydrogenase [Verrucomicrobiae bacterium]
MKRENVAVIGAAGHVGLGLTLSIADAGHKVFGIDINEQALATIRGGHVPFIEQDAEAALARVLASGRLEMTSDLSVVSLCRVVIVILGTPIDENLNPVVAPLHDLFRSLRPLLRKGQMVVLRSTVSPGTTDSIRAAIERDGAWRVGEDIFLVYAPERVVQGKSLAEIRSLPQIIGAYDRLSFRAAEEFFSSFVANRCLFVRPCEAELAKLMCNMARYAAFAIANEFYLIADQYQANIHRILDACSTDYPRFSLPSPGANVSGPCLFKDGFFLAQWFPFPELVLTAFKINESMPVHIFRKIQAHRSIRKVGVLGLTFKAGSDDTRYSLSFKMKKLLEASGYDVVSVDPYLPEHSDFSVLRGCDAVVLMTPHAAFASLNDLTDIVDNDRCWYVDIWGFWPAMRGVSENGCFFGREIPRAAEPVASHG